MLKIFQQFISQLKPEGTLIYNSDSPLVHKLTLPEHAIAYAASEYSEAHFPLAVHGAHNRTNALGVIALARMLNITAQALTRFSGIGRRVELLGEKNTIRVYDDYANHPTAFAASIATVREIHAASAKSSDVPKPSGKIWAVIEPHTYSRLRAVLPILPLSVTHADYVIVSKIFASRESDPGDFSGTDIVSFMNHPHARYILDFPTIIDTIKKEATLGDSILVMGSGDSYKLAREILAAL